MLFEIGHNSQLFTNLKNLKATPFHIAGEGQESSMAPAPTDGQYDCKAFVQKLTDYRFLGRSSTVRHRRKFFKLLPREKCVCSYKSGHKVDRAHQGLSVCFRIRSQVTLGGVVHFTAKRNYTNDITFFTGQWFFGVSPLPISAYAC